MFKKDSYIGTALSRPGVQANQVWTRLKELTRELKELTRDSSTFQGANQELATRWSLGYAASPGGPDGA